MLNEKYQALANPPQDALRTIEAGNLKGKSDINPQWKIEAMTEQYGLCGIGWKFEVINVTTQPCPEGQILLYMQVNLYVKDGDVWSAPIPGFGGDMLVEKNKNGLVPNDEAYKMCLTDALGNAMKCVGVAANVYRGKFDGKYARRNSTTSSVESGSQLRCSACGAIIDAKTADYSRKKYGSELCRKCQTQPKAAANDEADVWVKFEGTACFVKSEGGKWIRVENLTAQQCEEILRQPRYAKAYSAVKAHMQAVALERVAR